MLRKLTFVFFFHTTALFAQASLDILLPSSTEAANAKANPSRATAILLTPIELSDFSPSKLEHAKNGIEQKIRERFQLLMDATPQAIAPVTTAKLNAKSALEEVAHDLRTMKFQSAKMKLKKSMEHLLKTAETHDNFKLTSTVHERLIEVLLRLGQEDEAKEEMRSLLSLQPTFVFNPIYFASPWVDAAELIRKELAERGQVALRVPRILSHSRVFVDGVDLGRTPIEVTSLSKGPHWVRVESSHAKPLNTRIDLARETLFEDHATTEEELEFRLERAVLAKKWDPALVPQLQEKARRHKAEKIVIALVDSQDEETITNLIVFDAKSERFGQFGTQVESETQWKDEWFGSGLRAPTRVAFASGLPTDGAPAVTSNKRRILTIGATVAPPRADMFEEVPASASSNSAWLWPTVISGAVAASAAAVLATVLLLPRAPTKTVDLDLSFATQ